MKFLAAKILNVFSQLRNSFFAVIVLIQALLITLSVLFAHMTIAVLESSREQHEKTIVHNIANAIAAGAERPRIGVLSILQSKEIVAAFAKRDRSLLLKLTLPLYEELKALGFKQFQFHVPEGPGIVTFLRVHEPGSFGDDLANRPLVQKCNLKKEIVGGLEQGKSGYGFRYAAPVLSEGRFIGSIEIGYDFGEPFLKQLNNDFPGSWAIYNLSRGMQSLDDRILLATLGQDKDGDFKNLPLEENVLKKINFGETYYERSAATNTESIYVPVRNFQGDIAIVLKYVQHTEFYSHIRSIIWTTVIICAIGLILSGLIIYVLHYLIARPVRNLVTETEKIRSFQLEDEITFTSSLKEMNDLIDATRSMKTGLQSFKKYVPAQLVRQLIESKVEATVGGQRRHITVFFSDIADFTSISESLTPNELMGQLSEYLSAMTDIIIAHQGTVDKYIGDSIMAFWGAPLDVKNHAELASRAALACLKKGEELNARWLHEGKRAFQSRIGINSGEIIVGNIGSSQRLSYTIIGDDVNLASRIEQLNKTYGTSCMISENSVRLLPDDFALRLVDFVVVSGKTKPVMLYELVAEKGDIRSRDLEFLKSFNEAIALYKNRQWEQAITLLEELARAKPGDKATEILLKRCSAFQTAPPPSQWRGEFVYYEKSA